MIDKHLAGRHNQKTHGATLNSQAKEDLINLEVANRTLKGIGLPSISETHKKHPNLEITVNGTTVLNSHVVVNMLVTSPQPGYAYSCSLVKGNPNIARLTIDAGPSFDYYRTDEDRQDYLDFLDDMESFTNDMGLDYFEADVYRVPVIVAADRGYSIEIPEERGVDRAVNYLSDTYNLSPDVSARESIKKDLKGRELISRITNNPNRTNTMSASDLLAINYPGESGLSLFTEYLLSSPSTPGPSSQPYEVRKKVS